MPYVPEARVRSFNPRPGGLSDSDSDSDDDDYGGFSHHPKYMAKTTSAAKNGHATNGHNDNDSDWDQSGGKEEPPSPAEIVRQACMSGDLEKLKEQLAGECKMDINQFFGDRDENPLITACLHGRLEIIEYLLKEKSANPNSRHQVQRITPLMGVMQSSLEEETLKKCVSAIVDAGANVNSQERYGMTALMIAISAKLPSVAEYLLEKGADPNVSDPDGRTALIIAASSGDGKMCRYLLEKNADVNLVDNHGWSAAEIAQDKNFLKLADLLHTAKVTKWKPGLKPELMSQLDEDINERRAASNSFSVKDDSSIDLLLSAADGSKYLSNFRKHKISYAHLLKLDEDQLKEIGVEEVGVREKILTHIKNIQNAQWQSSSIRNIALNKDITSAEAVCMVVNIKEHLEFISSSLQYLGKRIKQKPLALRHDVERNKIVDLMGFCEQTATNCSQVLDDIDALHKIIGDVQGYTEFQIAGRISKRTLADLQMQKKSKNGLKKILLGLGAVAGLIIVTRFAKAMR